MKLMNRTQQMPSIGNFFDDFFLNDGFNWNSRNYADFGQTLPSVNVKETKQNFDISVAAPGMKKGDFKINLDKNNVLSISSEQKTEKEEKLDNENYYRKEFDYNAFCRSFSLPSDVDAEKIEAQYADGILKIMIPKKITEEIPLKKIEIK